MSSRDRRLGLGHGSRGSRDPSSALIWTEHTTQWQMRKLYDNEIWVESRTDFETVVLKFSNCTALQRTARRSFVSREPTFGRSLHDLHLPLNCCYTNWQLLRTATSAKWKELCSRYLQTHLNSSPVLGLASPGEQQDQATSLTVIFVTNQPCQLGLFCLWHVAARQTYQITVDMVTTATRNIDILVLNTWQNCLSKRMSTHLRSGVR